MKNLKTFEEFLIEANNFYGGWQPEDDNPIGWTELKLVGDVWPSLKDILGKKSDVKEYEGNADVIKWWNSLEDWNKDFIMSKLKVRSTSDISVMTDEHHSSLFSKKEDRDGLEYLYNNVMTFISFADFPSYYHKDYGDVVSDNYGGYLTKKGKKPINHEKGTENENNIIFPYRFKKKFLEPFLFEENGMTRPFITLANKNNKLT
jgi:hypothetical protein